MGNEASADKLEKKYVCTHDRPFAVETETCALALPGLETLLNSFSLCKQVPNQPKSRTNHGGDLLQHSMWTALQVLEWISETPRLCFIDPNLDVETAILAALLHDCGKATLDCVHLSDKYEQKGGSAHPIRSGDYIMNKKPYWLSCQKCGQPVKQIMVGNWIDQWTNRRKDIAVVSYMHWEFGLLNSAELTPINLEIAIENYIEKFVNTCLNLVHIPPTLKLLKLCILVSVADIAAGRFPRTRLTETSADVLALCSRTNSKIGNFLCAFIAGYPESITTKYSDTDRFLEYKMDKNAMKLYRAVISVASLLFVP
jgi:hypothetical protein